MKGIFGKFIGLRIDGYDYDDQVPIATGTTYDEAMSKALRRALSVCDINGQIAVIERPEMSDEDFAKITQITDEVAAKWCGSAA